MIFESKFNIQTSYFRQTAALIGIDFLYQGSSSFFIHLFPLHIQGKGNPDEGIIQSTFDEFTYQYRYDARNRCIAKKLSGTCFEHPLKTGIFSSNFSYTDTYDTSLHLRSRHDSKLGSEFFYQVEFSNPMSVSIDTYGSVVKDTHLSLLPVYDGSALNEVVEEYGPGKSWHTTGHSVKNDRMTNFSRSVRIYQAEKDDNLIVAGTYAEQTLDAVRTTDEDGNVTYEFKDKTGRKLLTRQMNGDEVHDTYTVYDDYGNVRFVLPPLAADSLTAVQSYAESHPVLQKYAYIYHYDKYNRCIYKKLPGCDPVYTVYDAADRPIFTQDGEQRKRNEWFFSIPDGFGRVVLSGICKNQPAYGAESTPFDTVVVKAVWANEENPLKGYRLEGITLSSPTVLSVSYYDSYDFLGKNGIPDDATTAYCETAGYGKRYGDDCKGQQTGILTARFTDREYTGFIYSALYYDDRYRVIQRKGNNGQHGTESVYTAYNFEGSPTKEKHVHIVPGQASVTEVHTYTYDLANRLLKSVYQLNDKDSITLVDNIYDEVGRLFVDRRNGVPELRTNYSYNLRSWLKGVSSPLFSQTLNYQETINDISPCYNGNISSLFWRTAQNNASNALISSPEKGYSFTYDGLSRLKDAVYGEGASLNQNRNRFNEQITGYDKMGNILGLLRYGQTGTDSYGLIDNLNLTYNGNQLQSVYDNATNSVFGNGMEFKDAAHETVEYAYDKNGNLTKDLNKNITEIQYNILNLPSHISFADGSSIVYEYAADGSKVRTTHTINDNVTSTVYCGNAIYENGSLKMLLNESGYYSFQDNKFHFYIKDHQGNIRIVADEAGKVDEVNDYYPFGGLMSNACNNTQPYKYNGKELDRKGGLDWYDYGARYYDPLIGMFLSVDPLSENFYSVNPYAYCLSNPFNRIDPTGMSSRYNWKTKRYEDEDGNEVSWEEVRAEYQLDGMSSPAVDGLNDWGLSNETDDGGNVDAISGAAPKVTSLKIIEPNATTVIPVVMPWKSLAGEAFGNIISRFIGPAFLIFTLQGDSSPAYVKEAKDSSNNEKHGDGGRTLSKDEKRIKDLKQKIDRSPNKKEKQALKKKLQNIKRNGEKQREGEEHSRTRKR